MKTYQFTKEESSAIQRLALDEALNIATVTFQRAKGDGKAYDYECSNMEAFQALVEQAMRDGTLSECSEK